METGVHPRAAVREDPAGSHGEQAVVTEPGNWFPGTGIVFVESGADGPASAFSPADDFVHVISVAAGDMSRPESSAHDETTAADLGWGLRKVVDRVPEVDAAVDRGHRVTATVTLGVADEGG